MEDFLDEEKRTVEVSLEHRNKRSILKARKIKLTGLSVTSPTQEDLPDLESVNSKIARNNQTSRKVIFVDEKGKILATSAGDEDHSMAAIRKIPKDFDPEERLMKKLKVLSDAGPEGKQSSSSSSSDLTFVDVTGRVLATSRVSSPGATPQRKVSSSLLGSALPHPPSQEQQEEQEVSSHLSSAWLQLRKISRNLEEKAHQT